MNHNKQMKIDVYTDVREKFLKTLGDSFEDVNSEQLIDYAVDNVFETSGIEDEGIYNMADVNLAVQRSIAHHLYDIKDKFVNMNSLTQSILEETTDYDWIDLSNDQMEVIFERTENIYDKDDVELIINKSLLDFGYEYNPNHLKWIVKEY